MANKKLKGATTIPRGQLVYTVCLLLEGDLAEGGCFNWIVEEGVDL